MNGDVPDNPQAMGLKPPNAFRPPLTLVCGPAGAGKTEWAIRRFLEADGRGLLVVGFAPQAATLAELTAQRAGRPEAEVRGAIKPFQSLVTDLLHSAGPGASDTPRHIGRDFQRLLFTDLVRRHLRQDDFLGRMLDAPGFVPALCDRVREWKLACISADDLEQGANKAAGALDDPAFTRKTSELARLFRAYEVFLRQNRLRDEEDALHDAARVVADAAGSRVPSLLQDLRLIVVDGFYHFNRAQRRLLAALASRGADSGSSQIEVAATLPYSPGHPLLFAAPERTRQILSSEFQIRQIDLPEYPATQPSFLTTLGGYLFDAPELGSHAATADTGAPPSAMAATSDQEGASDVETGTPGSGPPRDSVAPVVIFDAPNPYVEAEMVARDFHRLKTAHNYSWSDFAIILRGAGDYTPILAAVFERYGIPLAVDSPEALAENPLLKTLLTMLDLVRHDWPRDEMLTFLKSSYTAPDKLDADYVRRAAQSGGIRDGRVRWMSLVNRLRFSNRVVETMRDLGRLHDLLTARPAPVSDFIGRISECITTLGIEERISTGDAQRIEQDRAALKQGMSLLNDLAHMAILSGNRALTFAEFHDALLTVWKGAASSAPSSENAVTVCEPYSSRERSFKVAAVMGLTERVFPRRVTEDPFLRDDERIALKELAGLDLNLQKARVDDERFFFYLAVTAPSDLLRLSYPRSSSEADTLPSFYLDEIQVAMTRLQASRAHEASNGNTGLNMPVSPREAGGAEEAAGLGVISRTLADVAPRPDECVNDQDRLRAACAGLFDPGPDTNPASAEVRRRAAELMDQCLAGPEMRPVIRAVVSSRFLPRLPRLTSPDLRSRFAGRNRTYTIAALETYQRCPFQYLLRHVLRLAPDENDVDARAQGALLHAILRRHDRRRVSPDGPVPPPELKSMQDELKALLAQHLDDGAFDTSPSRLLMVRQLLENGLLRYAERDLRFREQFGTRPAHAHLAFGIEPVMSTSLADNSADPGANAVADGGDIAARRAAEQAHDPASCAEPLVLSAADGDFSIAVSGTIDRVDYDIAGRAILVDYRLDRPSEFDEIQRGLSLQLPLSLLALERVFGKVAAAACFDTLFTDGRPRVFRTEYLNLRQYAPLLPLDDPPTVRALNRNQFFELTRTAEDAAIRTARAIEEANIEATPGKHCRACPYSDICRTNLEGVHDGEQIA